jgi:hypothetical protein
MARDFCQIAGTQLLFEQAVDDLGAAGIAQRAENLGDVSIDLFWQ